MGTLGMWDMAEGGGFRIQQNYNSRFSFIGSGKMVFLGNLTTNLILFKNVNIVGSSLGGSSKMKH